MSDPALRPLTAPDADAAVALVLDAFATTDRALGRPPQEVTEERRGRFSQRMERFSRTDPDGCWAADDARGLAGLAVAIRRGPLWGLSLLFVRPDVQGRGLGGRLLERARLTAAGAGVEVIEASEDARAIRRYAQLGLALHPAMALRGAPDRSRVPVDTDVREAPAGDLDLVEAVDRGLRGDGATRTDDITFLLGAGAELLVVDRGTRRGFAVHTSGSPVCLGATDGATAHALLLAVLARAPEGEQIDIYGVTGAQAWAFDAALSVGLRIAPSGPLFLRGWPAYPASALPSGVYF